VFLLKVKENTPVTPEKTLKNLQVAAFCCYPSAVVIRSQTIHGESTSIRKSTVAKILENYHKLYVLLIVKRWQVGYILARPAI